MKKCVFFLTAAIPGVLKSINVLPKMEQNRFDRFSKFLFIFSKMKDGLDFETKNVQIGRELNETQQFSSGY